MIYEVSFMGLTERPSFDPRGFPATRPTNVSLALVVSLHGHPAMKSHCHLHFHELIVKRNPLG